MEEEEEEDFENDNNYIGFITYNPNDNHVYLTSGADGEIDLGEVGAIQSQELSKFITKKFLKKHI